jgi:hypothetical protein
MSLKPICVPCHAFYRPWKNGFYFLEMMPGNGTNRPLPGLAEPDKWKPYKLWAGDLWKCPLCNNQIVVGTGHSPAAEIHHKDFNEKVEMLGADQFKVNDC